MSHFSDTQEEDAAVIDHLSRTSSMATYTIESCIGSLRNSTRPLTQDEKAKFKQTADRLRQALATLDTYIR